MALNLAKDCRLEQMTVGQLHERYVEAFDEPVRSRHWRYLIRRIPWRLQADAEGGLTERALRRAEELANVLVRVRDGPEVRSRSQIPDLPAGAKLEFATSETCSATPIYGEILDTGPAAAKHLSRKRRK